MTKYYELNETTFEMTLTDPPASGGGSGGATASVGTNALMNPRFSINQRDVSGTVTLAAGGFGHDRWKAGTSGCTYTFTTSNGITTIDISAGSLQQVVEASVFAGRVGDYYLSWAGTAQAKIDGGAYGDSGIFTSCDGSANVVIEFGTGTVSKPQLELGSVNAFTALQPSLDRANCKLFFNRLSGVISVAHGHYYNASSLYLQLDFPEMRVPPTISFAGISAMRVLDTTLRVPSAIAVNSVGHSGAELQVTVAGGVAGNGALLRLSATSTIDLDAEIS